MTNYSRRRFLEQFGTASVLLLTGQKAFSSFSDNSKDFEFLVIGDSLVWGQGLREEDKFYYLTKEWLENEVFKNSQRVNLKVKAHSGAKLVLTGAEIETLRNAGKDETRRYHSEVNLVFPSIKAQIELAREAYQNENKRAEDVNLIMLTGGITDIKVSEVLNPYASESKLKEDIVKYCRRGMFEVIERAAETFPNALITIVGYYPIVSSRTPTKNLFNAILELYETPRTLKPLLNNAVKRNLFLRRLHKKITRRSQIWFENSNIEFQNAVNKLNARFGAQRAVFVKAPLDESNSYAADETLLWQLAKKGRAEDDLYEERKSECRATLDKLREETKQTYRTRMCELASVGHPNSEGSKAFAAAIRNGLKSFFPARGGQAAASGI